MVLVCLGWSTERLQPDPNTSVSTAPGAQVGCIEGMVVEARRGAERRDSRPDLNPQGPRVLKGYGVASWHSSLRHDELHMTRGFLANVASSLCVVTCTLIIEMEGRLPHLRWGKRG
ncbi:unnamed protein product [Ectocarpus fasciculatus]